METFGRIIRLGLKNFWRNNWLTLGATLLMTLTLTMVSVSLLVTFVIKDTATLIREKINLTIFFRIDKVPDQKIIALGEKIKTLDGVASVNFTDKTAALAIFHRLPNVNDNIKKQIGTENNYLPRSLEVGSSDVDNLPNLALQIGAIDKGKLICSDCISYKQNKEIVDQLIRGTRALQQIGWMLSLFFGIIAIFNVSNIVRLTVAARSDEIEIMRFVGASNAFIRGPFVVEGIAYGLLGTVLTLLALPALVMAISALGVGGEIGQAFTVLGVDIKGYVLNHLPILLATQLGLGLGLGVIVSLVSIRRYLRA
ncbi:hypothetical protein A3A71_03440 [Candidatus Berkelbacteria bacterium RIFCSPLOWO2_01_FULL_50_28]|uniref:Cell division protein FtsX n=1 Tax=Candidatus Berkelbacteria bacterium RIFCSPLOWO2_01_FULL_50_28 TaxID=1797471 RepID=A0A1F5ECN7_9BACT|nr:MAG: hypothetical protein A2807_03005 [Candidatus Berkelbacteria bacterium RIFCSPHIGHO2_01_FULL_50_36]OGD63635.1 MAG: hypothetical protein A3F39_04215 [Candidatus Berkelbacteria bacterium RIFCSPHIGHO2_12_FULL_50_11]OGD65111.1 MAG: hypothetical protein A3A71_03440 [Candidatus Berkelbacteria bacterium RIFCSPLOWO2_01_FULL_50_28]